MIRGLRHPELVVVTGGGSGIGRATSTAFAGDGATVIVADINKATADETVQQIRERGGTAYAHRLDVTDVDAWERFADLVRDRHGTPDVLVNNAGIVVGGSFLDHTAEDWERQLGPNLMGVIHGCRVFAPLMVARGQGGHIVNVSSVAAFGPCAIAPSYCVSKAGVRMLSECLRIELAPHGIGVTIICPGLINTNIGDAGTLLRLDPQLVSDGKRAAGKVMPILGADPSHAARAIVRSVRRNWAIVPVRPEAWLIYAVTRLSPRLTRGVMQQLTMPRAELALRLIPKPIYNLLAA